MTYTASRHYRPGEIVPISGQYAVFNPQSQRTGREITCVKGEVFPPGPAPGYTYVLVDATKHKRQAKLLDGS